MIWPFKSKPPIPPKPQLRWRRSDGSFRERSDYVTWASGMLNCEAGNALQSYLFAGVPQSISYRGDRIPLEQAAMEYFRLCGYLECLTRLQESAHMVSAPLPEIEADYDQTPPGTPPDQ